MYYHYQPGSDIVIVYCKHITHARAHARAHMHHTHRRRRLTAVQAILFGGAQPTVTTRSTCDNADRWPFKSTHEVGTPIFPRFWKFFAYKKILGRTETRTRDRMYRQTIRTVRDISRDDRARIATCSLRTLTDRQTDRQTYKDNYSIDYSSIDRMYMYTSTCIGQFHIGEHLMAKNSLQNSLKLLVLMYQGSNLTFLTTCPEGQ